MKNLLIALFMFVSGLLSAQQTSFSTESLSEKMLTFNQEETTFGQVLEKFKGQKILIDFWANWCRDCIEGMPSLKQLQKDHPNVVYLFLSLDRSVESWLHGIEKYELEGEHYFIVAGWKPCILCSSIDLDWIPRYMVVDETGKITLYRAITTEDEELLKKLR